VGRGSTGAGLGFRGMEIGVVRADAVYRRLARPHGREEEGLAMVRACVPAFCPFGFRSAFLILFIFTSNFLTRFFYDSFLLFVVNMIEWILGKLECPLN